MLERKDIEATAVEPARLLALAEGEKSRLTREEEKQLAQQLSVPPSPELLELEALRNGMTHPQLDALFSSLEENRVSHVPVPPHSHRPVIGAGVDTAKKAMMRAFRPFVAEVLRRQEAFNASTLSALRELESLHKSTKAELEQLRRARKR